MKLIAHRGYWEKKEQQNSFEAIMLGLIYSDGVEIDLRMYKGEIIVSHDHINKDDQILRFADVLALTKCFTEKVWALNIKEDGLSLELKKLLSTYSDLNYFCFDMSFPESVKFKKNRIDSAARLSDLELENSFLSESAKVFIVDAFFDYPIFSQSFDRPAFVISPELHGHQQKTEELIDRYSANFSEVYLCTDRIGELS